MLKKIEEKLKMSLYLRNNLEFGRGANILYLCTHIQIQIWIYIQIHECIFICLYICTYTYMYIVMYTNVHMQIN